jgi:pimeloyl-ACP methyl ester carboxylesterase
MLLFCPGLICDARIFDAQLPAFPEARAVGTFGLTDNLAGMADIVLKTADEAGEERFDLFGHSMGGRIALEVLRKAPDRVRRLALASTGVHKVGAAEPAKRGALRALGHEKGFEALVDAWLPPMVAEANRSRDEIYQPMRQMCLDAGQAQFDAQITALLGRPEVESLLPGITCPTLVITGELDSWAPPHQHEEIAAAIPDSRLVIVAGAGHMLPAEAPEAMNAAIAAWLDRPAGD